MSVTNLENAITGKVIGTYLFKTGCHKGNRLRGVLRLSEASFIFSNPRKYFL